jgi:pimeloyl-ACP methyl ester carboxylesterase
LSTAFISYQEARIHCTISGDGPHLLIALHGFGDQAKLFDTLQPYLPGSTTLMALDLPFHGQSKWHKPFFTKDDLLQIIQVARTQVPHTQVSVLGFSFGARLILGMLPEISLFTQQIFLAAPDGLATQGLGFIEKWPFKSRHRFTKRLLSTPIILKTLLSLHFILPKYAQTFIRRHLQTPDKIYQTLSTWLSMSFFNIPRQKLMHQLEGISIPVFVYLGKRDTIVPVQKIENILSGKTKVKIVVLDTGHHIVGEKLGRHVGQFC